MVAITTDLIKDAIEEYGRETGRILEEIEEIEEPEEEEQSGWWLKDELGKQLSEWDSIEDEMSGELDESADY